jgi:hypothetical protein
MEIKQKRGRFTVAKHPGLWYAGLEKGVRLNLNAMVRKRLSIAVPLTSVSKSGSTARTRSPKSCQISCMCPSCMATRLCTNSTASFAACSFWIRPLTITPPTGIPNS